MSHFVMYRTVSIPYGS